LTRTMIIPTRKTSEEKASAVNAHSMPFSLLRFVIILRAPGAAKRRLRSPYALSDLSDHRIISF
jgi:hypothetical protein